MDGNDKKGKHMVKVILTDVDGVLLNWTKGFTEWMDKKGFQPTRGQEFSWCIGQRFNLGEGIDETQFVKEFNNSASIAFLEPFRDAIDGVKQLTNHGYKFYALTSLSSNPHAGALRKYNLENVFGEGVFTDIHCLSVGSPKALALYELSIRYPNAWWIDDHPHNVEDGAGVGLRSILVDHIFNREAVLTGAKRFATWNDISNHILFHDGVSVSDMPLKNRQAGYTKHNE